MYSPADPEAEAAAWEEILEGRRAFERGERIPQPTPTEREAIVARYLAGLLR